jgi:hypothetical protein
MPLAPGTRLGRYEITAPLGAGGMGEVYRAKDTRLGRDVAVKTLPTAVASDPDRRTRFESEARGEARLFPLRDAYSFAETGWGSAPRMGSMGGNWTTPNPPFGAVFTYNIARELPADAQLVLTINDDTGKQVCRITLDKTAGLHRVAWDLRATGQPAVPLEHTGGRDPWVPPVAAGRYQAVLGKTVGDKVTPIGPAQAFRVVAIPQ